MNHYADIDEGQQVFEDERQRRAAEARFLAHQKPIPFTLPGYSFEARKLTTIHLIGPARPGHRAAEHPFDFEEGYLEALCVVPPDVTLSATLRWSNYGDNPTFTAA